MRASEKLHIFGLCISSEKLKNFGMGDGWQIKHGAYEVIIRYEYVRHSVFFDVLCFVMYNGIRIGSERYFGEQATPKIIEKFVADTISNYNDTISNYKKNTKAAEQWSLRRSLITVSDDDTGEYVDYGDTGSVYDNDREDFHSDG